MITFDDHSWLMRGFEDAVKQNRPRWEIMRDFEKYFAANRLTEDDRKVIDEMLAERDAPTITEQDLVEIPEMQNMLYNN